MLKRVSLFIILALLAIAPASQAKIHTLTPDSKVQKTIKKATDGDTLLFEPGIYTGTYTLKGKALTLASRFLLDGDPSHIETTILDGGGITNDAALLTIEEADGTVITGLTIRNSDDGISPTSHIDVTFCHIYGCKDAIDYETGSGGLLADCTIERNVDDAVDLDESITITIERNILRDNDDDGIEIRLQPHHGDSLNVIIRNNFITGNGEDGIQFIWYNEATPRTFKICGNLFADNEMAGIACMDDSTTREDYRAANIPEAIHVVGNTFVNNPYGIVGGDNIHLKNNTFVGCSATVVKMVDGSSVIEGNVAWDFAELNEGSALSANSFRVGGPHPEGRLGQKWVKRDGQDDTRATRWQAAAPPKPEDDEMDSAH